MKEHSFASSEVLSKRVANGKESNIRPPDRGRQHPIKRRTHNFPIKGTSRVHIVEMKRHPFCSLQPCVALAPLYLAQGASPYEYDPSILAVGKTNLLCRRLSEAAGDGGKCAVVRQRTREGPCARLFVRQAGEFTNFKARQNYTNAMILLPNKLIYVL